MSLFASSRVFLCESSQVAMRVLSSSTLASFDLQVGNASLACGHTCESLILVCGFASDASYSHLFVNLRLSSAINKTTHLAARHSVQLLQQYFVEQGVSDVYVTSIDMSVAEVF